MPKSFAISLNIPPEYIAHSIILNGIGWVDSFVSGGDNVLSLKDKIDFLIKALSDNNEESLSRILRNQYNGYLIGKNI